MSTATDSSARSGSALRFPAYGPVDAALGYGLFYAVVDRATPAIVDVLAEALPDASPSLIGRGLAIALWVVLTITVLDQLRRQLAALGFGTHVAVRPRYPSRSRPSLTGLLVRLVVTVVGGFVAAVTFDSALDTAVSLVRAVGSFEVDALVPAELAVLLVFFVAFGIAARAADRLIIGALRAVVGLVT